MASNPNFATGLASFTISERVIPGARKSYKIEDYIDVTADCGAPYQQNVAGPPVICDLSPAFNRIFADANATIAPIWQQKTGGVGINITMQAGVYELKTPIDVCRGIYLSGAGGGWWNSATLLHLPKGNDGFRLRFDTWCLERGLGGGAGGSQLKDFGMMPYTLGNENMSVGILVEAPMVLVDNIWVRGFVQDMRTDADHNRGSNANGFYIRNVTLDGAKHAGLFVQGGDANVGYIEKLNVSSNCQAGTAWSTTLGPCGNVVDNSFLGNTYIAAHAASAKDATSKEAFAGYVFEGSSQRNICVGCYAEHDQLINKLSANSNVIGGLSNWTGPGGALQGPRMNSLIVRNSLDPNNIVETRLGVAATTPGSFIEFSPINSSGSLSLYPLRLKLDKTKLMFRFDVANLNTSVSLLIGASASASTGSGGVWFPKTPVIAGPTGKLYVKTSSIP